MFLFTLFGVEMRAQVTADFVIQIDSGCVPFVAHFADSSKGHVSYRQWDFGNGNVAIGNNTTPSAVYNSAGVYDVTLTVSDGVDTSQFTMTGAVAAFSNPTANFLQQAVTTGCADFSFQVSDNSSPGSIGIETWEWDFDDGSQITTGQNVSHLYRNPGFFNVTLIVTDSLGCSNSKVKQQLVNVKPKPKANFYCNDSLSVCGPPLTISVFNSSTSTHPLSYNWNIGGQAFNTLNVNPTFNNSGGYDAELIVTSTIGCSDTLLIPNYVWIGSIVASMDISDTVCLHEENEFINTSFGGHTFYWDFGDGDTAIGGNVFHTYQTPGVHTVTMVSSGGSTCDDTVTQTLFVETVTANFTSTPHDTCDTPFPVSFTDLSVGNDLSWEWHFGNLLGYPPTQAHISFTQSPNNTYWYEGVYDDTLIVTSRNGCKDTLIALANEVIIITEAEWSSNVTKGCAPLDVNFFNLSDSISRVASWWWDFGDGSPIDYTFEPSHTFTNVGEYVVALTVVSIDGCTNTYVNDIKVGSQQNADFMIDTLMACGSDTVTFTNLSSDTAIITDYIWMFGDGKSDGSFEPWHVYEDTGYLDVTLIVEHHGCPDTLILDSAIRIDGPIIQTAYPIFNCDSQNVVNFTSHTLGGTNFSWDFGDSTWYDTLEWHPEHAYLPIDSNYVTIFTVWDTLTGCSADVSMGVPIRYLKGRITPADTTICRYDNVIFNTGNSTNAMSFVRWSIDGLANPKVDNSNTDYTMNDKGPHVIYAVVMDMHGCLDTAYHNYYVYEPIVNYVASPVSACAPSLVTFTDLSFSDTNIVSWNWDFGSGATSSIPSPSHLYNGNGTTVYDITFTVTDTFGCANTIDSLTPITVIEPPSFFTTNDVQVCENSPVAFSGAPSGSYTYFWDFDDGGYSTQQHPTHSYGVNGIYDISLTVTDSLGCDSTYVEMAFIEVEDTPVANFTAIPATSDCFPASIVFTDLSTYPNVLFWTWNFGDSPNDVIQYNSGAQNLYNEPGYYDVTMVLTTVFGCTDTVTLYDYIHIGGPTGNIVNRPEIGCINQKVSFSADSLNGDSQRFIWDFGDGIVDTTYAPNEAIEHTYLNAGFYTVSLLISDLQGLCQITDTNTIEIDDVTADFLISELDGCAPLFTNVVNNSVGEDEVTWLLNGNNYSQTQLDSFYILTPGQHTISLAIVNNHSQCKDTLDIDVTVHPLPQISLSPDALLCIDDSIQLHASGANSIQWTPGTYLNNDTILNPVSTPIQDISYAVVITDTNNCEASDTVNIKVQQRSSLDYLVPDTFIFLGTEIYLTTLSSGELWYNWTPTFGMGCYDCSNPLVEPDVTTTYTLEYGDVNGCFAFDTTITVEVLDEFKVTIPNTFTPGTDNLNDTFQPVLYGVEELVYMRIFDRWGVLVYETDDINHGWNGMYKNELVSHNSMYSYTIQVRRYNGDIKDYSGMVLVITNGL